MNTIEDLAHRIDLMREFADKENTSISDGSVAWHLEHSLMVINQIIRGLLASDPTKYQPKFSFAKLIVFATGRIPKGKARSPKNVTPVKKSDQQSILEELKFTKENIPKVYQLPKNAFITHPYFGDLNVDKAIKFMDIHTRHHLRIINDIIKE